MSREEEKGKTKQEKTEGKAQEEIGKVKRKLKEEI